MKICLKCKTPRHYTEFAFKDKVRNIRSKWCKKCHNVYTQSHYYNNKLRYKANKATRKAGLYKYIIDYLKKHPCVDCGETDLLVLEFDHVRGKKVANISRMLEFTTLVVIKEEIKKCQVRCANCHRRKTARDNKWKKTQVQKRVIS